MTSSHTGRSNSSRKEKGQLDTGMSLGASANAFIEINMSTNGASKSGSQPHRNRTAIDADNDAKESAGELLELTIKEIIAKLGKIAMETENNRNTIAVMRSVQPRNVISRNMDRISRVDSDIRIDNVKYSQNEKECWLCIVRYFFRSIASVELNNDSSSFSCSLLGS